MNKQNFLTLPLEPLANCHDGEGVLRHATVFPREAFRTPISFMNYTILPPDTSIGLHTHGDDEEMYLLLEGSGEMEVNGERLPVTAGDVVVNPPFGTHALYNTSDADIRILVLEVRNDAK